VAYAEPVRALLVVNPAATTTSARTREVIVRALASDHDVAVVHTTHRGHAEQLAEQARDDGLDAVFTLGGDGTVNEVVNGLLAKGPGEDVPLLGPVPGGSANVFVRALGLPTDPVEATGALLEAIGDKRTRNIGLGTAEYGGELRWFAFNAGVGLDAEIIESMERQRATGVVATPGRYVTTALTQFFGRTDRAAAALTVRRPGVPDVSGVHYALIQNTAPWTFLGPVRLDPSPRASFDTGLDLFAPRSMSVLTSLRHLRRMMLRAGDPSRRPRLLLLHDQSELLLEASHPMPLQVDGDSCGNVTSVLLRSVPSALDVLA
jgi:diacylglycerol kinase family enzyme